jgi:hypothetical protein
VTVGQRTEQRLADALRIHGDRGIAELKDRGDGLGQPLGDSPPRGGLETDLVPLPRRDARLPVAQRRARSWRMVAMSAPCSPQPSAARLSELRATDRDSLIAGWDVLMPKVAPVVRRSGITGPVHRRPLRRHRDARPRHAARHRERAGSGPQPDRHARPGCIGSASDTPRRRDRRSRPDRPALRASEPRVVFHSAMRIHVPTDRLDAFESAIGPLWWHPACHRRAGRDCGPSWSC